MSDLSLYAHYTSLELQRHDHGVLEIVMNGAGANKSGLATADANRHRELADIWRDIDRDPDTRVALIRGEGKGFSGGGDLHLVEQMASDFAVRERVWREARDLVYNIINCSKPIVSAMHGPAVGAGLVAGLLADISIAAKTARIIDGHTRLPGAPRGPARRLCGRCCAAWRKRSTTCCCANRSAARKRSGSVWCRWRWMRANCCRKRLKLRIVWSKVRRRQSVGQNTGR